MLEAKSTKGMLTSENIKTETAYLYCLPLIILLTYLMMGAHFFFTAEGDYHAEGAFKHQIVLSFSFLLAFIFLIKKPKQLLELLRGNWLLILVLLYALISCLWSPVPFISFKRWFQFLGISLVGLAAVSSSLSLKPLISVLRFFTAISMTLSFFLTLIHPSSPFIMMSGNWNGLFNHKNALGAACALSLAVWLPAILERTNKMERRAGFFVVTISLMLLVLSRSATAVGTSMFLSLVFFVIVLKVPIPLKVILFPIPILLVYSLIVNLTPYSPSEFIIISFGRDTTFSGRTGLWETMIDSVHEHPYFGVGYNGFWTGEFGFSSFFTHNLTWGMNQAHNGYLDVMNELGLIGLVLFLALLLQALVRGVLAYKHHKEVGLVLLLIVVTAILGNVMETTFCRLISPTWLVFLIAVVAMRSVASPKVEMGNSTS